jgi:hypothetical protein
MYIPKRYTLHKGEFVSVHDVKLYREMNVQLHPKLNLNIEPSDQIHVPAAWYPSKHPIRLVSRLLGGNHSQHRSFEKVPWKLTN